MNRYYLRETGAQVQKAITDVREKTIYENATTSKEGLMSASDKVKLNDLEKDTALSLLELEAVLV